MAAPKGNQFWKIRSKHGRDKLFATPDIMWQAAVEYFEWCEENPLLEVDYRGKDATQVVIPKMRAFTLQGLCLYMDCNVGFFTDFRESLKGKSDDTSKDFSLVVTRIQETIYNQKFSGAASGFFNSNIIARDLGLQDTKNVSVNVEQPLFPDAKD